MQKSTTVLTGMLIFFILLSLSMQQNVLSFEKGFSLNIIDTVVVPKLVEPEPIYEIKATYYNPVPEQCDGDPLITADMSHIDLEKLENREIRWVAVSRDMLSRWGGPFNYGDTVYIYHNNQPELTGMWIIHDTMNARHRKRIDFLLSLADKIKGKFGNILISKKPFVISRII